MYLAFSGIGPRNYLYRPSIMRAMRQPIFSRFGLSGHHHKTARIYITRSRANTGVCLTKQPSGGLIARYGFETVDLENLNFRQQVELFHRADLVIGPHGAGLKHDHVLWATFLSLCSIPPRFPRITSHPGQGPRAGTSLHLHPGGEDDDFTVITEALERLLPNELGSGRTGERSIPGGDLIISKKVWPETSTGQTTGSIGH